MARVYWEGGPLEGFALEMTRHGDTECDPAIVYPDGTTVRLTELVNRPASTPSAPKAAPSPRKELLSPAELADYVGVPVRTVYQWNHSGTGPAPIKIGRHVRYRATDVESWINGKAT